MSFSRARIRRFNEATGNTPAPGSYNPKCESKIIGTVIEKSERFAAPKSTGGQATPAALNTSFNAGRKSSSLSNLPIFRTPKVPHKGMKAGSVKVPTKGTESENHIESKISQELEAILMQKDLKIRDLEVDLELLKEEYERNEKMQGSLISEMMGKLESSQATIMGQDETITSQEALLSQKITEINRLETEVADKKILKDKMRSLSNSVKALKSENIDVLKVKTALDEKNDDLVKEIFKLQSIEKELLVRLSEAENTISENSTCIKNAEDKMEFLQVEYFAEKVILEDKIEDLYSQRDEFEKMLANKEETILQLKKDLEDDKQNAARLQDEMQAVLTDLNNKEHTSAELKEEFEKKLAQKQEMILLLQGELSEKELELEELSSDHAKLLEQSEWERSHLNESEAKVEELSQKVEDLKNNLKMMEENVMNASILKENLESTIACQQTAFENLQVDYDSLRIDLEGRMVNQIMESSRKFSEVSFELLETRAKLQYVDNNFSSCNQNRMDLESRLIAAMQEIDSLTLARDELRVINVEYQLTIADLHDKADTLAVEVNANSIYCAEQIEIARSEARKQCKNYEVGNANLIETLQAVSNRLLDISRDSETQCLLITELEKANTIYEKKISDQAEVLEGLKLSMIVMEAESIREIEEVRSNLLKKLEYMGKKYDEETNKVMLEFSEEIAVVQGHVSEMAVKLADVESRYCELQQLHSTLQENFNKNGVELEETKFDLLCLQDVLKEKEEKIKLMESDIAIFYENCEQLSSQHASDKEAMVQLLNESNFKIRAFEANCSRLQNELSSENSLTEELNNQISLLSAKLNIATTKLVEDAKEIEELNAKMTAEKMDREQEKSGFLATIKQKEDSLGLQADREEHWSLLSAENLAKEGQLQDLRLTLQRTKEKLDAILVEKSGKDKQLADLKEALQKSKEEMRQWESEDWKNKYVEMASLVGPFRRQLEEFEAERNALESRKEAADNQVKDLSMKYAQILGHQNHKQKIHHVIQLKEHNLELKQTVEKLEGDIRAKDKTLKKLKSDLAAMTHKQANVNNPQRKPMTPLALSKRTENTNPSPGHQSPNPKALPLLNTKG